MPARVGRRGFRSRAEETGHLVRSPVRSPRSAMGRVAQAIGAYDVLLKPLRAAQVDNFLAAWNRTCQPANVLLVESSQKTLDVVARLLRQSSFKLNLDFSGTARETLKALVPEFYDIAFVNLALADGSGVETALRVIARSPSTKIITFGNHDRFTAATLKSSASQRISRCRSNPMPWNWRCTTCSSCGDPICCRPSTSREERSDRGRHLFKPRAELACARRPVAGRRR